MFVIMAIMGVLCGVHSRPHDLQKASTTRGWNLLGSTCFGYKAERDRHSAKYDGGFDLLVKAQQPYPEGLVVLLYDDESKSYPALTDEMSCQDKVKLAKDVNEISEYFTVTWSYDGTWNMPHVPIGGHTKAREWYVVLANCDASNYTVEYDLLWEYYDGIYDAGTGPSQCSPDWTAFEQSTYLGAGPNKTTGMIAGVVALAVIVMLLILGLARECKKTLELKKHANLIQADTDESDPAS